jgi:hypothetical protein
MIVVNNLEVELTIAFSNLVNSDELSTFYYNIQIYVSYLILRLII